MGLFNKLFKKEKTTRVVVDTKVNELPNKVTLKYDEQVITVEAFRKGLEQGATIRAFLDGNFIPLRQLGDDLLIWSVEEDGYVSLNKYDNPEYQDIKTRIFGGSL